MPHALSRLFIVPLLLAVSACAGTGDKYPFPPQFVSTDDICPCILGAPPAADSAQSKKERTAILARQAKLSAADKAAIAAEDHISPGMMVTPVLGAPYNATSHPQLFALLHHAASDAWRIGDTAQEHWGRQRPWVVDNRVALLVSSITRPSYPSGHSTTNHVWAHVLSELFPAKKTALFTRANAIGQHRVDAGVHYPSDVAAGKKMAAAIYEKMHANPAFQQELAAARTELKAGGAPHAANDNVAPADCLKQATGMAMCR